MTNKQRITKLEKAKPTQAQDMPAYQTILEDSTVRIRWQSGRVTLQEKPLPRVKTYQGWSPSMWDETAA
jgi:hypothetical protein